MPASISVDQLEGLRALVKQGNISAAYTYLADKGYNYANWANGVATANSLAGASAVVYLQNSAVAGLGSDACKNLTQTQIQKIRTEMALGYLDMLEGQGPTITHDVSASEATDFHRVAFKNNHLGIENWTLDIPFKLLGKSGGQEAVERYWQGMMQTGGTGLDAHIANTSTYALVLGATYSKDPETRALAQQWLETVPGFTSGPSLNGLGSALQGVEI